MICIPTQMYENLNRFVREYPVVPYIFGIVFLLGVGALIVAMVDHVGKRLEARRWMKAYEKESFRLRGLYHDSLKDLSEHFPD